MPTTESGHRFTVITLFPEIIRAFTEVGVVRRACERGIASINSIDPRSFTPGGRGNVDDSPYGGGPGMVMTVPPLRAAIHEARAVAETNPRVVYLSPQGRRLDQPLIAELVLQRDLILVAGRYEGIDERIVERDVDLEISLGDFVLSGGEIAAMAVVDAVVRLLPGALGSELSSGSDSFSDNLLEYPQYTRPEVVDGQSVPAVLLSGNHAEIARWRRRESVRRTALRRPDLLGTAPLSAAEKQEYLDSDIAAPDYADNSRNRD
ncbi:MAG: tRNA (guanosine(37)-N1)-methyltransferase TrmD [Gammaproteobacteria bacterium]|jgi:tRNA (guanine37-N1)-methyltransferase